MKQPSNAAGDTEAAFPKIVILAPLGAIILAVLPMLLLAPARWMPADPVALWTFVLAVATAALVGLTAAVAVVGAKGLASLSIARREATIRAQRESRVASVRLCEEFGHEIIPSNAKVLERLNALKVPVFVDGVALVKFGDKDDAQLVQRAVGWVRTLPPELQDETIRILNRLEAWAMPFAHGLADHSIAFEPCARVYCQLVIQYYPCLLALRRDSKAGKYRNLIHVFEDWSSKVLTADKAGEAKVLLEELNRLQTEGGRLGPPLGLET